MVRLTFESQWPFNVYTPPAGGTGEGTNYWRAFAFTPSEMPGFGDYGRTYTHFRIIKARLYVSRTLSGADDGDTCNYVVVGSRPFASTTAPLTTSSASQNGITTSFVPNQLETALRQTKWQKVLYPTTTSQRVKIGFHPYTMVTTNGPVGGTSPGLWSYQRVWEGRKWTPMNWVIRGYSALTGNNPLGGALTDEAIQFFGPYMIVETPTAEVSANISATCTLELQVQFRGQK